MLKSFFSPQSIAVIGASSNKKKLGYLVYENIKKYGYKGKIYPINIKGGKIGTTKVYEDISAVKGEVDLAVVIVPAQAVPGVIRSCGMKGVSSTIIISAGFRETGKAGKKLEEEIAEIAEEYSMRIIGPNCLGVIDSWARLNASFAESMPDKMNISFFSQSGAICTAILDWANMNGIGFSRFISLGNKLDVDESEIMQFLKCDEKTSVVLGYLESIKDGRAFMDQAEHLAHKKPLIMVKSGRTKEGAKSISSHTGSIAGSDVVVDTAMKQCGIIRAFSLEDLFDYAKIFAFSPEMKGKNIAVISNAGGPAVMSADYISKSHLKLVKLGEKTVKMLEETLPEEASIHNPVDVVGDARSDRYEAALDTVLKDDEVDAALIILTPQVTTEVEETARLIVKLKKFGKPIAVSFMGGKRVEAGKKILEDSEIPSYDFPERAIKSLEALYHYHYYTKAKEPNKICMISKESKEKARHIVRGAFEKKQKYIIDGELSAFDILDAYGFETAKRIHEVGLSDLEKVSKQIRYPLVVKTSSKEVLHKTDIGGIVKGVSNHSELQKAYFGIRENVQKAGFSDFNKVDIYQMEKDGVEIFLGAKRDPSFGPLIIFGLGGTFVEATADFSYRIAPICHHDALKMIKEIKSQKVLDGFRGLPEANRDKVGDAIVGLSQLMLDFPEIKEIDINPMVVTDRKAVLVDAKIILDLESHAVLELVK